MNTYQMAAMNFCAILCVTLTACTTTSTEPSTDTEAAKQEPPAAEIVEIATRPFPDDSFHELLVAEFAVRRNRYDLALGNYLQQAHHTQDPGVTARATRLAQFLQANKATLDAAQLWTSLEPANLEAQYTLSTMLAKNQQPLEAIKHMTVVLENGGKTNFAAIAASALSLPDNDREVVEQELDKLLTKHPANTQLLTAKSLLLQQRGKTEAALTLIRDVLDINSNDLHAVVVEARLLQQLGRGDEAYVRLEKVVSQHPNNRRLRLQYARMLMTKDINLAKQQFEILLKSSPNDPDLLLSLALINKEIHQPDEAERYFQQLLKTGRRTTEAHYYLGQLAELRDEWQQAIDYYKLIPPGSNFLAATNRISQLYLKQGRVNTASEYMLSLRQQYPEHSVRIYLLESELLLSRDHLKQGHALLTEALLAYPQHSNLLYARSMFNEKLGKLDAMEQDLRTIINQDKTNAVALNALGYILANHSERLDEARDLINQALTIRPGDPAILDSLGWVEFRRGNVAKAIELLTKAYQSFPDHEVAAHLGEALWANNQQQQALIIWRLGLKRSPDSLFITETMQRLDISPPEVEPSTARDNDTAPR